MHNNCAVLLLTNIASGRSTRCVPDSQSYDDLAVAKNHTVSSPANSVVWSASETTYKEAATAAHLPSSHAYNNIEICLCTECLNILIDERVHKTHTTMYKYYPTSDYTRTYGTRDSIEFAIYAAIIQRLVL